MRPTFVCITAGLAAAATLAAPSSLSPARAAEPAAGKDTQHAAKIAPLFRRYQGCFVLRDLGTGKTLVRYRPERCAKRFAPCSTFKIVNSLVALETGVAPSPEHKLRWDGKKRPVEAWNRDLTLREAFRESAVWYFQEIATGVGQERMSRFLSAMPYGNADTSGGITKFWLSTSLAVSADEQVAMLTRLQRKRLAPFSEKTQAAVLDVMRQPTPPGAKPKTVLRGKTGTEGTWGPNGMGSADSLAWFVGTVERDGRAWAFAVNIDGDGKPTPGGGPLSKYARAIALEALKAEGVL